MPALKTRSIRNPTSKHPLMRDLTGLDEIAFSDAFRFDLTRQTAACRRACRGCWRPTARRRCCSPCRGGRSRTWCMTFPLVNDKGEWTTNWNLKLSFPVFLRNVLYQLGNVSDAAAEETIQPGQIKMLRPERRVERIEVASRRRARRRTVARAPGRVRSSRTRSGWRLPRTWPGGGGASPSTCSTPEESNTQPRDEIKIGEQNIEADQTRLQIMIPGSGSPWRRWCCWCWNGRSTTAAFSF